jgi:anti-sigma factor RsiW
MENKVHEFVPGAIMAYLDGELSASESLQVVAHIEDCPTCAKWASGFRDASRSLAEWRVETDDGFETEVVILPEALAAALQRRLSGPEPAKRLHLQRQSFWLNLKGSFGLAAALVCLIGFVTIWRVREPPRQGAMTLATHSELVAQGERYVANVNSAQQDAEETRAKTLAEGVSNPVAAFAPQEPLLVKATELRVRVANLEAARNEAENIIRRHAGYLGQLDASSVTGEPVLSATLRVAASELDLVMAELRRLGRVESESVRVDDVTRQSVDLDARIGNSEVTEQRLLGLLNTQTAKLSDVLAVEAELSRVREQLETMRSERKSLTSKISFTSIQLSLREEVPQTLPSQAPFSGRVRQAFREGVDSLGAVLIGLLLFGLRILPTLAVLTGAAIALLLLGRWVSTRANSVKFFQRRR